MEAMIENNMLKWAVGRAQISIDTLSSKLSVKREKIEKWLSGEAKPTFRQAQTLAKKLHIPFGYLFLSEPPKEEIPFPDFRTIKNQPTYHQSAYLMELLYDLERKQQWYREYLIENGYERLSFVGSASMDTPTEVLAKEITSHFGMDALKRRVRKREDFIYELTRQVEAIGIVVLRSSYAGTGTQNSIKVEELRGLAIADDYAPFIFINSADSNNAQVFTLMHELAHIWLGQSGISDIDLIADEEKIEKYCNDVAAEVLLPQVWFRQSWKSEQSIEENLEQISKNQFVSQFVVLKRAYDVRFISFENYRQEYERLMREWEETKAQRPDGGNYYNSKPAKESRRLSLAIVESALEGKMLYRDALDLLNIKSMKTFNEFAKNLGVA